MDPDPTDRLDLKYRPEPAGSERQSSGNGSGDCVILQPHGVEAPPEIVRLLVEKGLHVRLEHSPMIALAELGRIVMSHRHPPLTGRSSEEIDTGGASRTRRIILLMIEPERMRAGEFAELVAVVERSMSGVAIATYEAGRNPRLKTFLRSSSRISGAHSTVTAAATTAAIEAHPQVRIAPGFRNHPWAASSAGQTEAPGRSTVSPQPSSALQLSGEDLDLTTLTDNAAGGHSGRVPGPIMNESAQAMADQEEKNLDEAGEVSAEELAMLFGNMDEHQA